MHRAHTPALRRALLIPLAIVFAAMAAPASAAAGTPVGVAGYPKLERFALSLLNCTRTGGWVRQDGTCRGGGTGKYSHRRKPLVLSSGIAERVSRPYALKLAEADACMHTLHGSSISSRLRAGGFKGSPYGESVGCSGGYTARRMLIRTHRMFQAEGPYDGWHWRNLKNPDFRRVGIGVATYGSESRVVYDFYGR